MKIYSLLLCFLSTSLMAVSAWSDDAQFDIAFNQGSVLVICATPEAEELSTEAFSLAFPEWITALQKSANNGVVTRAHYLGDLKSGVFIVVGGDTKELAMANALSVTEELNAIYEETTGNDRLGGCEFREIGPVAVLPQ